MDIVDKLNHELLKQDFAHEQSASEALEPFRETARSYARTEGALAVLSDLRADRSYLFYGAFAKTLGMRPDAGERCVDSIWEKEILRRIHPEDLHAKYLQELRFFRFLKRQPKNRRFDYYLAGKLRMKDAAGNYLWVLHRLFYIPAASGGAPRLALCLYNPLSYEFPGNNGRVIDSTTGQLLELERRDDDQLLTDREKEVLRLIDKGMTSKQIAAMLSRCIHTVSRHRQEILAKLQVRNSIEACRIARDLGIIR